MLTGDGAEFQREAVKYWADPAAYVAAVTPVAKTKGRRKKGVELGSVLVTAFTKHAKLDNGNCTGFKSDLFSSSSYFNHETVKRQLIVEHHGKCAYCESFIMTIDTGDVEHYRPKSEVTQANPGNTELTQDVDDHPGYFWLSQTWDNLFLACKQCNQSYKGTLFDVAPVAVGPGAVAFKRLLPPDKLVEVPMLLSPTVDGNGLSPRHVLRFDTATARIGAVAGGPGNPAENQARAARTIGIVGLNRPRLLQDRAAHLVKLRALFVLAATGGGFQADVTKKDIFSFEYPVDGPWKHAQVALRAAVQPYAEYSGLAEDAILTWNAELDLQPVVATNVSLGRPQTVYVNCAITLPLLPWVELAERLRREAEANVEREAAPPTRDLDVQFNAALDEYKQVVGRLKRAQPKIVAVQREIHRRDLLMSDLEAKKQFTPQGRRDDLIIDIEAKLRQVDEAERLPRERLKVLAAAVRLKQAGADPLAREAVFNSVHLSHRQTLEDFAKYETTLLNFMGTKVNEELAPLAEVRRSLEAERDGHRRAMKPFDDQQDALLKEMEALEVLELDGFSAPLSTIYEDMVLLAHAYRARGVGKDRTDRVEALGKAASGLDDHLRAMAALTDDHREHLLGKGWPPRITIK